MGKANETQDNNHNIKRLSYLCRFGSYMTYKINFELL